MGWLQRLARSLEPTPPAQARALSLSEYMTYFTYGGSQYPLTTPSMAYSDKQEVPDPSFAGYVQGAFKANGIVFACIVARMLVFSEARFQFRQIRSGRPGDLFGTEALRPLERPWQNATTGDLLSRAITDADLAGNFYARRNRGTVKRLRPDWVTIVLGSELEPDDPEVAMDADVLGYIYRPTGPGGHTAYALQPGEVAHWAPIPDPLARFRGMSWLTPVIREIVADQAATQHKTAYFEGGATKNYAVIFDPAAQVAEMQETERRFREVHGEFVTDPYRTVFLGGGADIKVLGDDLQQSTFKEVQGAGETRICMAARVPPIIAGSSEGLGSATYSNYAQARRAFADLTMRPLWRQVAGALSSIIDVPANAELWYDDRDIPFLQEDVKDAADILEALSRAMRTLGDGGWEHDSVRDAVVSGDLRRLKHTGLTSVQMQPPGQQQPEAAANGKPGLPIGGASPQRALVEHLDGLARKEDTSGAD